jgi:hypothetical protein
MCLLLGSCFLCLDSAFAQRQPPLGSVPFELVGEKIFMKARVNGSEELNLQFDTGAGSTVIDDSTAQKLGLVFSGETNNEGAAGSIDGHRPDSSERRTTSRQLHGG